MPAKTRRSKYLAATILMAVVILAFPIITNATDSSGEKINEDPIKCEPACLPIPPPPPLPSCPPPPPPPSLPFCPPSPPPPSPSPPPPSPPPPPLNSCCQPSPSPPPPPPLTYIFLSPPGDLYPIDHDYGAAAAGGSVTVAKLVAFGVVGFMIL